MKSTSVQASRGSREAGRIVEHDPSVSTPYRQRARIKRVAAMSHKLQAKGPNRDHSRRATLLQTRRPSDTRPHHLLHHRKILPPALTIVRSSPEPQRPTTSVPCTLHWPGFYFSVSDEGTRALQPMHEQMLQSTLMPVGTHGGSFGRLTGTTRRDFPANLRSLPRCCGAARRLVRATNYQICWPD
jgi:hypothetical protein